MTSKEIQLKPRPSRQWGVACTSQSDPHALQVGLRPVHQRDLRGISKKSIRASGALPRWYSPSMSSVWQHLLHCSENCRDSCQVVLELSRLPRRSLRLNRFRPGARLRLYQSVRILMLMTSRRILAIGLDGFELTLAERFQAEGILPNFAHFQEHAACYKLDHGRDKYSGLTWEHLSSGVAPSDGGRWSSVSFDRDTYSVRQEHTAVRPFLSDLSARTVVFDFPYFDLSLAPNVCGITNWGAHDPGVARASRPDTLREELNARFGSYPATDWIYGFCWPSADRTRAAGEALVRATELRSRVAAWLFAERLPEWDLGVVVVSECHSAIEPLWHGVDENHPLHTIESAPAAAAALRNVYRAMDKMIGDLWKGFPDATMLLFAMHGMGPNDSDVPAMALLPELLHRFAFGSSYMRPIQFPAVLPDGTPLLSQDANWETLLWQAVPNHRSLTKISERVANWIERAGFRIKRPDPSSQITWMPAARYSHFWPRMKAFALPSYYDGRIRLNVVGREAKGTCRAQSIRNSPRADRRYYF